MKFPAKPEPEARAVVGSPEISHAEEPEMPDDNERASEREELEGSVVGSAEVVTPFEDHDPTGKSANDSTIVKPANTEPANIVPANTEPSRAEPSRAEPSDAGLARPKRTKKQRARSRSGIEPNNVRKLRQEAMMSKAELARRAGVSPLTIDRVEAGCPCRMDTKRKILEALGLKPSARTEVWPDIDTA
ncbi:MAG: helix-turn-helix transcriptional regulator [Enhygromyxa sp.]